MAVSDAHVFPGFFTPALTQLSFQSHRLLFSHTSAEVRDENMLERKLASNLQPPSHKSDKLTTEPPGLGFLPHNTTSNDPEKEFFLETLSEKEKLLGSTIFSLSHSFLLIPKQI